MCERDRERFSEGEGGQGNERKREKKIEDVPSRALEGYDCSLPHTQTCLSNITLSNDTNLDFNGSIPSCLHSLLSSVSRGNKLPHTSPNLPTELTDVTMKKKTKKSTEKTNKNSKKKKRRKRKEEEEK